MWTYVQSTGELLIQGGHVAIGYSGYAVGKNNPDMQHIKNLGPVPCGLYRIGDPFDSAAHGPFCLPLKPDAANEMFDRRDFLMHGDSIEHPGMASHGCICAARAVREQVHHSGDRGLRVIARREATIEPVSRT